MEIERKYFENGVIKKEVILGTKFGQPFKLIKLYNSSGEILQVMEKPNLKLMAPSLHVSGAHVVYTNPSQNHIENFNSPLGIQRPEDEETFSTSIISAFIPSV